MKNFPYCFSGNGVQVANASSHNTAYYQQNRVCCVYCCHLQGRSCLITITWSKSLMGQPFSIEIENLTAQTLCRIEVKPWKKRGFKTFELDCAKICISWDLTAAKFGSGPEPIEGFYLSMVSSRKMVLLVGDMKKEAFNKAGITPAPSNSIFISKREHILGKRVVMTRTRFYPNDGIHDLAIECNSFGMREPCLCVSVDGKTVMQVKHLLWKFRGNHTISVEGVSIDVYWDVYEWMFSASVGRAVFMFRASLMAEKLGESNVFSDANLLAWSCLQAVGAIQQKCLGFSLVLYAWKHE